MAHRTRSARGPFAWAGKLAGAASTWATLPGPLRTVVRPAVEAARGMLVRMGDPCVNATVAGTLSIELPLSHDLPKYRALHPLYDTALGRLARAMWEARPGSSVIDIGANVGDTAAIIRAGSPAPILCIEGSDDFYPVLERNALRIGDLYLAKTFVGPNRGLVNDIHVSRGTARLGRVNDDGGSMRVELLEDVVARYSELPAPALVKIDTDGFDCPIIEAAIDLWARWRPALFFEYDPDFYPSDWNPLGMFGRLRDIGYERGLVYENSGEFVVSIPLSDASLLEDMHVHYSGWSHARYADLCLFHKGDRVSGDRFRRAEAELARAWRSRR